MPQMSFLPDVETDEREKPVNVASVPQRSPFRYPGGKTWFVPLFRRWMQSFEVPPRTLVEPFAGDGIISLTAAFEKLTDSVVLVELDDQIAAVWETILRGEADWLAKRIVSFELSLESAKKEFARKPSSRRTLFLRFQERARTKRFVSPASPPRP